MAINARAQVLMGARIDGHGHAVVENWETGLQLFDSVFQGTCPHFWPEVPHVRRYWDVQVPANTDGHSLHQPTLMLAGMGAYTALQLSLPVVVVHWHASHPLKAAQDKTLHRCRSIFVEGCAELEGANLLASCSQAADCSVEHLNCKRCNAANIQCLQGQHGTALPKVLT